MSKDNYSFDNVEELFTRFDGLEKSFHFYFDERKNLRAEVTRLKEELDRCQGKAVLEDSKESFSSRNKDEFDDNRILTEENDLDPTDQSESRVTEKTLETTN